MRTPPLGPDSPAARKRPGGTVEYSTHETARGGVCVPTRQRTPSWRFCLGFQTTMEAPAG